MDDNLRKKIKEAPLEELPKIAESIRQEIIETTSKTGGHLASNLGIVEITMAIHRNFDLPNDKLLFDVGHQCYVHKLLSGRDLSSLRKKDGISGFQKREESPYDCFEAGHSSTSISAAIGMACARDLNKENYHVIAVIGDASIASGMAFEALNDASHAQHKIIIILNDNEMSISRPVGGTTKLFSKIRISYRYTNAKGRYRRVLMKTRLGRGIYKATARVKNAFKRLVLPVSYFETLGLDYVGPIDGHNFISLDKALKKAKKSLRSVVVHCQTIKGKGYEYAEKDTTGYWHGVGPFDLASGQPLKRKTTQCWSAYFSSLIDQEMEKNENIVYINPAMIRGNEAENIFAHYHDRAFDVGIAEEHAISLASGFSLAGKYPIIAIYSTFIQRSIDQINQDLCRMNLPSLLLIDRAGLVGEDGETHQGIFEEAMLDANPNMTMSMPANKKEAQELVSLALNHPSPFAIRYPRGNASESSLNETVELHKWIWYLKENHDSLCIGNGPLFYDLFIKSKENELKIDFLNAIFMKPIDTSALNEVLNYKKIIIYSPYTIKNGWVNNVLSYLMESHYLGQIIIRTIPCAFIKQATIEEQLNANHLSLEQMLTLLKDEEGVN